MKTKLNEKGFAEVIGACMTLLCLRYGHISKVCDLMNLKQCLSCGEVEEL